MVASRRRLWNACFGNLFEHYDTALFGFLSPFLAPLIFPKEDPITALILTYAILPLGMLARPLGALFFGFIGDVYGRERSLFLTLTGMAIVSGCIAFTPTYLQAGILAPLLFCLGRILQNFLAAGETMGGAIFILDNAEEKRHDWLSSLYSASAIGGHLLASFGVYLISQYSNINNGWRLLYLCGCVTALFGCALRRSFSSSPSFTKFSHTFESLKKTLWSCRKEILMIIVSSGFAHATYSIAFVLMNGLIPLVSSLTKADVVKMNTYLLVLDFFAFPFFGWMASKVSREKWMLTVCIVAILMSMPLMALLQEASTIGIVGVRVTFILLVVAFFAPFHAWAQQLIPSGSRYVVISLGYAIGSQVLGSPTAAFALWCFKKTGMISSVVWYWMFLALATSLSIAFSMRSKFMEQKNLKIDRT